MIGFNNYNVAAPEPPTVEEILAALSGEQKLAVLDGFAQKVVPVNWRQWMKDTSPSVNNRVPRQAIKALYEAIDAVEGWCRTEMRGERVVTEAVIDEQTGEETSPAVYNTAPSGIVALRTAVWTAFTGVFTSGESSSVVNKMVLYSSMDALGEANGTWTIYSNGVKK